MIPKNYKSNTKQYKINYILPPYQFKKKSVVHYHIQINDQKKHFEYDIYLSRKKIEKFNITDNAVERLIETKLIDLLDSEIEECKRIVIGDDDIEKFLYNRKMEAIIKILNEKGILKREEVDRELENMDIIKSKK
jgi:hypothetical protein